MTSEDRFRVLFDHSSDAHFIFDGGGVTDCNEATVRLLRCRDKSEVLALHPADLSPKYQPDGSLSAEKSARMDAIARERGWHRFEWVHKKRDGEEFPVEVVLNAVTIGGRPAFVAVWHDLTEVKRRQRELERLGAELEARNAELTHVNARMRADLEAAAEAQSALLPHEGFDVPGFAVEWLYKPSVELGGDLLNVMRLEGDLVGMYVLDVTGHGAASALLSVTASHFLSSLSDGEHHDVCLSCPSSTLRRLNRYFSRAKLSSRFFTLVYGVLDPRTRVFRYASAGHPPPLAVTREGETRALESSGIPVGLFEEAEYETRETTLAPGERLYLFSDGFYEERRLDGEEYGLERLRHFFAEMRHLPVRAAAARARTEIEQWTHPRPPQDDLSLLILEAQ